MLTADWERITNRGITMEQEAFPFKRVGIYGAGGRGRAVARRLAACGVVPECFIDSDPQKHGTLLDGLRVIGPEDLRLRPELPVLLASFWSEEILFFMRAQGLGNELFWMRLSNSYVPDIMERHGGEIQSIYDRLADEESRLVYTSVIKSVATGNAAYHRVSPYAEYLHPCALPRSGQTVVDGGAYNGDTAKMYLSICGDCHVHAFEPDPLVFESLTVAASSPELNGRITPHRLGLWESSTRLSFSVLEPTGSRIDSCGANENVIQTVSLDEFAAETGSRIDLVKLDVEGAEAAVLRGAAGVIRQFRPTLVVCLYHKALDCVELPLLTMDLAGEGYSFYVGHHGSAETDTVLYAVPN